MPTFRSMAVSLIPSHAERYKYCQKCEKKSAEIFVLKEQIKQKTMLLEDLFMNASIQEKYQADMKAKLEEERRVSAQLRSDVTPK